MCGRITITEKDPEKLAASLQATWEPDAKAHHNARYNVAPTQQHPIVRLVEGARRIERAEWGLTRTFGPPKPNGDKSEKRLFNAQGETVAEKPAFKKAFTLRRCVIPATGFYEWFGSKKERMPLHFTRRDGGLLLLAGIYDDPKEGEFRSFTIVTIGANNFMKSTHDRMPVILEPSQVDKWLSQPSPDLLRAADDGVLDRKPASALVNSVKNDRPECLDPEAGIGDGIP